jgi:hypothetical protein
MASFRFGANGVEVVLVIAVFASNVQVDSTFMSRQLSRKILGSRGASCFVDITNPFLLDSSSR